jgi:heme-degrading monooxygenase HmoA
MIAPILRIPGTADSGGADIFERFKATKGVLQTYRLEASDGDPEVLVVTMWDSAESREAFNSGPMRREVDQTFSNTSRRVYEVLGSK